MEITEPLDDLRNERISISLFDLHCIARLLQSALAKHGTPYYGCQYCKYSCIKRNNAGECISLAENADFVMAQLRKITGVGLSVHLPTLLDLEHEKSPCLDNKDFSSETVRGKFFSPTSRDRAAGI